MTLKNISECLISVDSLMNEEDTITWRLSNVQCIRNYIIKNSGKLVDSKINIMFAVLSSLNVAVELLCSLHKTKQLQDR